MLRPLIAVAAMTHIVVIVPISLLSQPRVIVPTPHADIVYLPIVEKTPVSLCSVRLLFSESLLYSDSIVLATYCPRLV